MEVSGQLHAPAALPQGRSTWYPLYRRLGGSQSQSEHGILGKYVVTFELHCTGSGLSSMLCYYFSGVEPFVSLTTELVISSI